MKVVRFCRPQAVSSVAVAVALFVMAIPPMLQTTSASALTSGIVETDLALNLDPNLAESYSGAGVTVTDLSGGGRNGTLAGTPLPAFDGSGPKAFEFTRTYVSNTASTANKISINSKFLTDNFTIQTWIKTNQVGYSTAHYTTMYIMASECGGGAADWGMGVNNTGKLAFGAGPSDATFATSEAVNTNAWVNVAATREKATGQIKLYINGVLKTTGNGQSGNSLTCAADGRTWIGNGQDAPAYSFGGKISTVLAYTRVLTASDILTNYNATVGTFYPVTYNISYNANGATSGTVPANGTYTTGGSASVVAQNTGSLARTGYTFAGWNTTADGTGTTYTPGVSTYSSNADVTLYAMWTLIPTTTTSTTTTTTTTTVPPAVVIDIQVPVTTIAGGQGSTATVAPQATTPPTTPSRSSSATTVKAPTTTVAPTSSTSTSLVPPVIPRVSAGESALDVGGVTSKVDVTREDNQLIMTAGPLKAVLSGANDEGARQPLDSDGNLRLNGGDVIKINMNGFKPDSKVDVWLFSTPRRLGSAVVGKDGSMSGSFTIPKDVESGSHRIAIKGLLPNGKSATFTLGIAMGGMSKTSTLTRVLIAIPIALAVGIGFAIPNQLRRRRRNAI